MDEWPLLVLCPKSLGANWRAELGNWLPRAGVVATRAYVLGAKDELVLGGAGRVVIASYDTATRRSSELGSAKFGVIIADESQTLKSADAQRSKALLPLIRGAKRALLLSGTPLPSRPAEIFTQANALRPRIFRARRPFEERFCQGHQDRFGWNAKGAANLPELHAVLLHAVSSFPVSPSQIVP